MIQHFFHKFRRGQRGIVAVELALVMPMLIWAVLAVIVFFDAYRVNTQNVRAGLTIADMVSREMTPINDAYLTASQQLMRALVIHGDTAPDVRVTLFTYQVASQSHRVIWSGARGTLPPLVNANFAALAPRLPVMMDSARALLVETEIDYVAPLTIGIGPFGGSNLAPTRLRTFNVVQPRFIPSVCFDPNPTSSTSIPLC